MHGRIGTAIQERAPSDLLTPAEVAGMFGVGTVTVNRWARSGKLPSVLTPGRQHRFRVHEIRALLAWTEATPQP
jgi:excisionase family DNA binding protein